MVIAGLPATSTSHFEPYRLGVFRQSQLVKISQHDDECSFNITRSIPFSFPPILVYMDHDKYYIAQLRHLHIDIASDYCNTIEEQYQTRTSRTPISYNSHIESYEEPPGPDFLEFISLELRDTSCASVSPRHTRNRKVTRLRAHPESASDCPLQIR